MNLRECMNYVKDGIDHYENDHCHNIYRKNELRKMLKNGILNFLKGKTYVQNAMKFYGGYNKGIGICLGDNKLIHIFTARERNL